MKPSFIIFTAALAACPALSHANSSGTVTREYAVASHGTLIVDTNNADITLEPATAQAVRITAREHCQGAGALESPRLDVSVAHSSTYVQIRAEDSAFDSSNRRAEIVVQVPRGFDVRVRDGEGNIRVGNIGNVVDAKTEFGTVRYDRHTQPVEVAEAGQ